MGTDDWIRPTDPRPLTGSEPLGDATVLDFWRWALGDLRMNNARGHLVEFLVARAVGDRSPRRVEWGPYDVRAGDGTRIEVKATGRLQSWATRRPSTPTWAFKSVRADRVWSDVEGDYVAVDPADRVHVWVFALHTTLDPDAYDPLELDQWEFRVVPHRTLLGTGRVSAGLSMFERLGIEPVSYWGLPRAVTAARAANDASGAG
jgi:hypothetical protein